MIFLCPNIQFSNLSPFQDVKLTILTFTGYWLKNVSREKIKKWKQNNIYQLQRFGHDKR